MSGFKKKYLSELSKKYPTREAVLSEIIKLSAILELPKGTEHFISDIHGEAEALSHIMRNASGVIRRKLTKLYSAELSTEQISELATLIYYPEEKLSQLRLSGDITEYLSGAIVRLVGLCRFAGAKYTRSKVRERISAVCGDFSELILELIGAEDVISKRDYYERIYSSLLSSEVIFSFIPALCSAIKSLVVDRIHVVGDLFDRGSRADLVMDELMRIENIDFQWGNHDALWMGAAAGSEACCAAAVSNSLAYGNLEVLEIGYGISLRPLWEFAQKHYYGADAKMQKLTEGAKRRISIVSAMHRAITIIEFKLASEVIERNPSFNMEDRQLLRRISEDGTRVNIEGVEYLLNFNGFAGQKGAPWELTDEEREVISYLKHAFMHSSKLRLHIEFLYKMGGMYKIANGNLLFHGCIPLDNSGKLLKMPLADGKCGRALMDFCDSRAREGYFAKEGSMERQRGQDFLWFLWCGSNSPLSGREKTTKFERFFIDDKRAHNEPKNGYFKSWNDSTLAEMILSEFGLNKDSARIVNGHIPIKKGEHPIKGGGRIIVIDGGFCSAYHTRTGIGGYTLIYNADGMRISAHEPFAGKEEAIKRNADIISETVVFEKFENKIKISETDDGGAIKERISDLRTLFSEYNSKQ